MRTKYICPKCSNAVEVFVKLSEPPVCKGKHIGVVTMNKVEEINDETK